MRQKVNFIVCILALILINAGCLYYTIQTDYTPQKITLAQPPRQKLYLNRCNLSITDGVSSQRLREVMCAKYPLLFTNEWNENACPIDVTAVCSGVGTPNGWSFFFSLLGYGFSYSILPAHMTIEDLDIHISVTIPKDRNRASPQTEELSSERVVGNNFSLWSLPWSDSLWMGDYDYGPFKEVAICKSANGRGFNSMFYEQAQIRESLYEEIAAMIVATYNRNPEQWTYQAETIAVEPEEDTQDSVDFSVVRKGFDASINTGEYRVKFNNSAPSEAVLNTIQAEVRAFCNAAYRENNPLIELGDIVILNEDYRAIGKSLTLYEFTIKLGAVEFLDLQYDNSTLLGTISIRLPGGNPTNARKWVTENLDRLVEEYNISADNPIEGEYQLSSEKMSADGTYTVAFEVVN